MEPSLFYTGLVSELYAPLRGMVADPEPYARFIALSGEPALELGCGDGHPLLQFRAQGMDVEGLDSSADMLDRCRAAAAEAGLDVVLHHQLMERMDIERRFRSIFLAGATFNLLPDDHATGLALERIRAHLVDGGSALIPLLIPGASDTNLDQPREIHADAGALLRFTAIGLDRDEQTRCQTTVLRYERVTADEVTVVERPWLLHWHTQDGFAQLARAAGLDVAAVLDPAGRPATDADAVFAFWLTVAPD